MQLRVVGKNDTVKKRTLDKQNRFLQAYSAAGTVTVAASAAGIHRDTVYRWASSDTGGFRGRFGAAKAEFADHIEAIALERVKSEQGSDLLLIALLNAHKPEKYRATRVNKANRSMTVVKMLTSLKRRRI